MSVYTIMDWLVSSKSKRKMLTAKESVLGVRVKFISILDSNISVLSVTSVAK